MKLFGYEIRKVLVQRTGCMLIGAVWLLGQLLFWQSPGMQNQKNQSLLAEEIREVEQGIEGMDLQESLDWLEEKRKKLDQEQEELFQTGEFSTLLSETDESVSDRLIRLAERSSVLDDYLETYRYLTGYPGYLDKVLSQAAVMEQMAVFQKQGSFALANIRKTKRDFQRLKKQMDGIRLAADAPELLPAAVSFEAGSVLLLLQLLVLSVCIFGYEQEGGRKQLLTMQYRGRLEVSAAKILLLAVGTVFLVLLMYGGFLLQAYEPFCGGDWTAPVQSLTEFRQCSRKLSCLEYLIWFLLCKSLAAILFAFLSAFCVSWKRSSEGRGACRKRFRFFSSVFCSRAVLGRTAGCTGNGKLRSLWDGVHSTGKRRLCRRPAEEDTVRDQKTEVMRDAGQRMGTGRNGHGRRMGMGREWT